MIKNKSGESLIGILMGMFILSLVILGIINIIITSRELSTLALSDSNLYFVRNNSLNILNKLDLSNLALEEEFYIKKDSASSVIILLTGSTNSGAMYIDRHGYVINDLSTFEGFMYTLTGEVTNIDTYLGAENRLFDINIREYVYGS